MDDMLESLKGQRLPSLPSDFRQDVEESVKPVLHRRRWARRGWSALVVSVGICFAWVAITFLARTQSADSLGLDRLLELHFQDGSEPVAGSDIVIAIKQALANLSAEELVAIQQEYVLKGKNLLAKCWAPVSLRSVVEKSDVLVHAQVTKVTPDAEGLRESILSKMCPKSLVRTDLRLQVLKAYPPMEIREIEALCSVSPDAVGNLEEAGGEGIFALARVVDGDGELYRVAVERDEPGGMYWLDPRSERVLMPVGPHVALDKAWEIMCGLYDYVYGDDETKDIIFDGVLSTFRDSNSLDESHVALEYLKLLSKSEIPQDDVIHAIEVYYKAVWANRAKRKYLKVKELEAYLGLVSSALRLLVEVGDEDCVDRVLSLWFEDMKQQLSLFGVPSYIHNTLDPLSDLVLKFPGQDRKERLVRLCTVEEVADNNDVRLSQLLKRRYRTRHIYSISSLQRTEGDDAREVLLAMFYEPGPFGIRDSEILGVVWEVLAHNGCTEIRPLLDEFISDPEGTDLGVTHHPDMEATIGRARHFRMRALMNALNKKNLPRKEWEQQMVELYYIDPKYGIEYIKSRAKPGDTELIKLLDE
jgi:hypothetical protein